MPVVRINLEGGETAEEAEEIIFKAFSSQRDGSMHDGKFHDSAMEHLSETLIKLHEENYEEMLREICEELDKEYLSDGD